MDKYPIKVLTNHQPITKYTIFGERHSGTNLVAECMFYHSDIPLTYEYGWKHFFGFCDESILQKEKSTLFICITRNPYDWLLAMRKMPYHVTHLDKTSESFFLEEWYSNDSGTEILEDRNYTTKERYKNIFDLRSNKLRYLYYVLPKIVENLLIVDYNKLVNHPKIFFDTLQQSFNIIYSTSKFRKVYFSEPKKYSITNSLLHIFNSNIDWSIESDFGYAPKMLNNDA